VYDVNVANQIAEDQIDDLSDPEFEVVSFSAVNDRACSSSPSMDSTVQAASSAA
jgi:hypothetical protein